jgi:signal transduction histidine kinase
MVKDPHSPPQKNNNALNFTLEQLEKIISGTDDVIFILDAADNSLVALNTSATQFLAKEKSPPDSKNFLSDFPAITNQLTQEPTSIKQILSSFIGTKRKKVYIVQRIQDGVTYELAMDKVDIGSKSNLIFMKLRDISHRITSKEEAIRFVHTIGHELKQPLSLIKAYTYYIKRNLTSEQTKLVQYPEKIDQQVDILTSMLNDIVDTTKLSNQKIQLNKEPVELVQWFNNLLTDIRAAYPARHFVFNAPPVLAFEADPIRLRQAIMNLCMNAVKYSAEDSTTTINLEKNEDTVTITITDQGTGIPASHVHKIFEPYFRSPQSKKSNPKGLGLGLSLVREIVKVHGGKISVTSEVDTGSCFTIHFPTK